MFRGRHDHAIDAKGRVSIPAGFRMEIQRRSENPPVLTMDKECLVLRPFDAWERFEQQLTDADPLRPDVQALTRFYMASAENAPIDSQGRILIPKHLRKHANLERDVTVAGVGPWIEIWDTSAFERVQQFTLQNLDPMRASVADRGKQFR